MTRILLTGGGSGGHIYPLLAVTEELKSIASKNQLELEIHYLGPQDAYTYALQGAGIITHGLSAGKIRRYLAGFLANMIDIPRFFWGLIQAWWKMFRLMPDAVFSKGGPGALPVVLVAWFYRIPIIVHDSDSVPGLTNLLSGRFAKKIAVSFESAQKYFPLNKVIITGNPVRNSLLTNRLEPGAAKSQLGFDENLPLTLILGGSQGAVRINESVVLALKDLLPMTQVLHQTGQANLADTKKLARTAMMDSPLKDAAASRYKAVPYFENDLHIAMSAADLIVSRAGSGNIFEIAAFGKPAILIPLPEAANDHQRLNAYEFTKMGGGVVIEQPNLLPGIFVRQIQEILNNPQLAEKMHNASSTFFKPDASRLIAEAVLGLVK